MSSWSGLLPDVGPTNRNLYEADESSRLFSELLRPEFLESGFGTGGASSLVEAQTGDGAEEFEQYVIFDIKSNSLHFENLL